MGWRDEIKKPAPNVRRRLFNPKKPSLGSPGRWFFCVLVVWVLGLFWYIFSGSAGAA